MNEFNRMIADCRAGKTDVIITKSISRFARNTLDAKSEVLLSILSSLAQDESHVIVQFAAKKSTFQYPEAFREFLTAEDEEIQQALLAEIAAADALVEETKIKAEEARKADEQARFGVNPIFRESYVIGNTEIIEKGYTITEDCIGCGKCVKSCPQKAIEKGKSSVIHQEHCLHCGNCFEHCPVSAIKHKSE